jgi:hypothetical protein
MSAEAEAKAAKRRQDAIDAIMKKVEEGWTTAEFDMTPLTLEEFKSIEQYDPELAQFIQESAPQMVREGEARDAIRAEKDALQRLTELSQTGETAIGRGQRELGNFQAEAVGGRLREEALQELARTGQLRGGERILSETAAASDAAQRAREASLQAAAMEEQRRQQALGQVGDLASRMRQEEMTKERTNVDIANSFNQRLSMRRQAHLDNVAQQRNQAQQINQQRKLEIQQKNTAMRNAMKEMERQRTDEIARYRTENANKKLMTMAGVQGERPIDPVDDTTARTLGTVGEKLLTTGVETGARAMYPSTDTTKGK